GGHCRGRFGPNCGPHRTRVPRRRARCAARPRRAWGVRVGGVRVGGVRVGGVRTGGEGCLSFPCLWRARARGARPGAPPPPLAAALAASDGGAEVVIAERSPHFRQGSNSAMSTAMIPAGGSRWQREHGIDDSPEQFLGDMTRATEGSVDPTVSKTLTSVAPRL